MVANINKTNSGGKNHGHDGGGDGDDFSLIRNNRINMSCSSCVRSLAGREGLRDCANNPHFPFFLAISRPLV